MMGIIHEWNSEEKARINARKAMTLGRDSYSQKANKKKNEIPNIYRYVLKYL